MDCYHFALIAENMKNSALEEAYSRFSADLGFCYDFTIYNLHDKDLSAALLASNAITGYTVTMPYKETIMQYMDEFDQSALSCHCVNTIAIKNNQLIGYNTDGWGLLYVLNHFHISIRQKNVIIIGAGAVASSIAYYLQQNSPNEISIFNRNLKRAQLLCEHLGSRCKPYAYFNTLLKEKCKTAALIINATALGQLNYPDFSDLSFLTFLKPDAFVFDVNYGNPSSSFLRTAKALGLPCSNGRLMSICQGIKAMEIWIGQRPSDHSVANLFSDLKISK
ncbi:MAG: hypothetical protein LIP16_11855 [Clostridium sp.]|nr:hypothetical protein [Clostridium sp.]